MDSADIDLTVFDLKYACRIHDMMDCFLCGLSKEDQENKLAELDQNVKHPEILQDLMTFIDEYRQPRFPTYEPLETINYQDLYGHFGEFRGVVNTALGEGKNTSGEEILDTFEIRGNNNLAAGNQNLDDLYGYSGEIQGIENSALGECKNISREEIQDKFEIRENNDLAVGYQLHQNLEEYGIFYSQISSSENINKNSIEVYPPAPKHFSTSYVTVLDPSSLEIVGDIEIYTVEENCNHTSDIKEYLIEKDNKQRPTNNQSIDMEAIQEDLSNNPKNSLNIGTETIRVGEDRGNIPQYGRNIQTSLISVSEDCPSKHSVVDSENVKKCALKRPAGESLDAPKLKKQKIAHFSRNNEVQNNSLYFDTPRASSTFLKNNFVELKRPSETAIIQPKKLPINVPRNDQLDKFLHAKSKPFLSRNETKRGSATLKSMLHNFFSLDNAYKDLCNSSLTGVKKALKRQGQLLQNLGDIFFSPCLVGQGGGRGEGGTEI